jgi:hypothetical protein
MTEVLERVAFRTSRLADFCSIDGITKAVGQPKERCPWSS